MILIFTWIYLYGQTMEAILNKYCIYLIVRIQFFGRFKTFLVFFSDTTPVFPPHHIQCLSRFISIRISTFAQHISPQRVFILPTISYVSFTFVQGRNNFRLFSLEIISAFYFLINLTENYIFALQIHKTKTNEIWHQTWIYYQNLIYMNFYSNSYMRKISVASYLQYSINM
jgi:hypothetical protein